MKKVSNREMIKFINTTNGMSDKELPLKLAFAISHNRQALIEKYKPYDDLRKSIMEKHKENMEELAKQIEELLDQTFEVSVETVPKSEIEKTDTDTYSNLAFKELVAIESLMLEKAGEKDAV